MEELKRLFLAMDVVAPWPETFPSGRILLEEDRHLTLVFLGETNTPSMQNFPPPPFSTGFAGIFDKPVFLPHRTPRVVAYHLQFLEQADLFFDYQKNLASWFDKKYEHFLAHVTVARGPFSIHEWKEAFAKLPCFTHNIRLCESLGHSRYKTRWELKIPAPFEPIEHTADLAFLVRGHSWEQFDLHAWLALSFHEPSLIEEYAPMPANSLEDVVRNLNARVSAADEKRGCPFKAVSYHGQVQNNEWEMIVDV